MAEAGALHLLSIEKKHGRSIAEWQQITAGSGLGKHLHRRIPEV